MNANEIASNQKFTHGGIAAAHMAMRVSHIRMRSASTFNSFMSPLWLSNTIGSCS